jgi:hypothetical protein
MTGIVSAATFPMMKQEWGRKAILTGWLVAMAGIAGYVYTMLRAPENAGILEAIVRGGPIGWLSAALVVVGVGIWLAGNLALLREMAEK